MSDTRPNDLDIAAAVKETAYNSYSLMKTMHEERSDESTMRSWTWSTAVKKQRRRRRQGTPLLPEEATQRQPSVLGEGARSTRTDVTRAG